MLQIWSIGAIQSQLLYLPGNESTTAERKNSVQGIKRVSYWDLTKQGPSGANQGWLNNVSKALPILTDAENVITFYVKTNDYEAVDDV